MERHGNMLILGMGRCKCCQGYGTTTERRACPLMGKAVNTRPDRRCPHCGSARKNDHRWLETGRTPVCENCKGSKVQPEDRYDYLPKEVFAAIPMKVYYGNGGISFNEAHLGIGCVWSCQDYGAHKQLSDDQLIAKLREADHGVQACKLVNEKLEFCEYIGIFTNAEGYSLRAIFPGQVPDPAREVSTEEMLIGGRNTLNIYR